MISLKSSGQFIVKTLGVALEAQHCRAALIEHTTQCFHCVAMKTITYSSENTDAMLNTLKNVKSLHQKACRLVIGIPNQRIMTCNLTIDADLSDHHIMQFLVSQSTLLFGYCAEQLGIDYEREALADHKKQNIRVVAAHRPFITHIEVACKQLKMPLHVIEPNDDANARFVKIIENNAASMTLDTQYATAIGLALRAHS